MFQLTSKSHGSRAFPFFVDKNALVRSNVVAVDPSDRQARVVTFIVEINRVTVYVYIRTLTWAVMEKKNRKRKKKKMSTVSSYE